MSAAPETTALRFDALDAPGRRCAAEIAHTANHTLLHISRQITQEALGPVEILHRCLASLEIECERHRASIRSQRGSGDDLDEAASHEAIRAELVRLWGRAEAFSVTARWALCLYEDAEQREANGEIQ